MDGKAERNSSVLTFVAALFLCIASGFVGFVGSLAIGGFGICAGDLTLGLFVGCFTIALALPAIIAAAFPKAWIVGALSFSLPAGLGLSFAVGSLEKLRAIAILACILGSFVAAFVSARLTRSFKRPAPR